MSCASVDGMNFQGAPHDLAGRGCLLPLRTQLQGHASLAAQQESLSHPDAVCTRTRSELRYVLSRQLPGCSVLPSRPSERRRALQLFLCASVCKTCQSARPKQSTRSLTFAIYLQQIARENCDAPRQSWQASNPVDVSEHLSHMHGSMPRALDPCATHGAVLRVRGIKCRVNPLASGTERPRRQISGMAGVWRTINASP